MLIFFLHLLFTKQSPLAFARALSLPRQLNLIFALYKEHLQNIVLPLQVYKMGSLVRGSFASKNERIFLQKLKCQVRGDMGVLQEGIHKLGQQYRFC